MGPDRHSGSEMHRSTDDTTGADIAAGQHLVTDGTGGFTYETASGGTDSGIALFLDHGTVGATEDIDQSAAYAHWITLDVNCTLTFSGAVATVDGDPVECSFTLYVEQDGSGGNTITWPGSVVWPNGSAPTLDTSAGAVEVLTFSTPDGGTTWFGFHGGSGSSTDLSDDDPEDIGTTDPGVSTEASRSDHVHAISAATITAFGFRGEILISDTPSNPLVFADLLQNDDGDDLLYADL